jgi:O-antigen ligase
MSNASALFRSLLAYGICLPLAVFLGYLLATPLDRTTISVVVVVVFVLVFPLLLRWHHFWLIAVWNMSAIVFFLPGKPPFWMVLAAASLGICILQYTLNRNMKSLSVPTVARPLVLLMLVVVFTMRLTGGFGLGSLGSDTNGGRFYVELLAAVAGYFAIINRRVPPKRAGLYVAAYFLGAATMVVADLPGRVSPAFNFLFLLFPVADVSAFTSQDLVIHSSSLISRSMSLPPLGTAIYAVMLARYGIRGVLDASKPWRLALFGLCFVIAMLGGYRSTFVQLTLCFAVLFYAEGMHRTRWLLPVVVLLLAGGGLTFLFANRLPYSIQRSLAVVPLIPLDPLPRLDAAVSSEWRLQMWRDIAPQIPRHLLVGRGYAFSETERRQAEMRGGSESTEMSGNFHNGPISVILPFGIPGLIAFIWFMVVGLRVLYQNYRFGDPALHNINIFLFAYFVVNVVFFVTVYGQLYSDMHTFLGVLGLNISLNGGVAKPAVVPQSKIVFNRFKLHPSVRRPAGA